MSDQMMWETGEVRRCLEEKGANTAESIAELTQIPVITVRLHLEELMQQNRVDSRKPSSRADVFYDEEPIFFLKEDAPPTWVI